MKKHKIAEVKKPSYETKLAEIEKQGKMVTLEAKIDALAEMIETKNNRLSLVSEDENLSELIDKKKIKEMQKEIKLLEKTKLKLEKLYEKKSGGKKKEIVDEEKVDEYDSSTQMIPDKNEDGTYDMSSVGMKEGEDSSYEEDDDKKGKKGKQKDKDDLDDKERIWDPVTQTYTTAAGMKDYYERTGIPMFEEVERMKKLAGIN